MKKILIALDYNPAAQNVAEQGMELAKIMGAKPILMHVIVDAAYYSNTQYSPIMGFMGYSGIDFQEFQALNDNLKKMSQVFLDKTKEHLGNPDIETFITEGDIADAMLDAANILGADVLVIGSHGHNWVDSILMGNVMTDIIKKSKVPLYIIPLKRKG